MSAIVVISGQMASYRTRWYIKQTTFAVLTAADEGSAYRHRLLERSDTKQ